MTDTLIICLTVLIALGGLITTWLYHQAQMRRTADKLQDRAFIECTRVSDLADRLQSDLVRFESATNQLRDQFSEIPRGVSALSERQVVLEGAIKAALAELVRVTGYSEAKYQQLMAKTVTAPRKPGQ
jgi:hypothetical protein